jgi:hypothetical protein
MRKVTNTGSSGRDNPEWKPQVRIKETQAR